MKKVTIQVKTFANLSPKIYRDFTRCQNLLCVGDKTFANILFNLAANDKCSSNNGKDAQNTDNENGNNTNVVKQEMKSDPVTSVVPVKENNIISLFGTDKSKQNLNELKLINFMIIEPWYGIVRHLEANQMRVTFLEVW